MLDVWSAGTGCVGVQVALYHRLYSSWFRASPTSVEEMRRAECHKDVHPKCGGVRRCRVHRKGGIQRGDTSAYTISPLFQRFCEMQVQLCRCWHLHEKFSRCQLEDVCVFLSNILYVSMSCGWSLHTYVIENLLLNTSFVAERNYYVSG